MCHDNIAAAIAPSVYWTGYSPENWDLTAGRVLIFLFNMESGHQHRKLTSHHHPVPNLTMCTAGLLYFHSPQQVPSRVLNYEQGHVLHNWKLPSTTASKRTIFNCTYKEQDPLTMADWPQVSAAYQHNLATAQKLKVFRTLCYKEM